MCGGHGKDGLLLLLLLVVLRSGCCVAARGPRVGAWSEPRSGRCRVRATSTREVGERMAPDVRVAVVGAGVVGCAIARRLALGPGRGQGCVVVDAAGAFGTGVSSRSSEVVHAGIYYPAASLKAWACVAGRRRLAEYASVAGVKIQNRGKLIVATSTEQMPALQATLRKAEINGVVVSGPRAEVRLISKQQATALEPALACEGALWSTCTSVVDSHGLMSAFVDEATAGGVEFVYGSRVSAIERSPDGVFTLSFEGSQDVVTASSVVNCAGLHAPAVARATVTGVPAHDAKVPRESFFAKGNYFRVDPSRQRVPFQRLVYPLPEAHGLGVHLTIDVSGNARFGPDVEWVTDPHDVKVDARRADAFYAEIRKYWPDLRDGVLEPDYAGIRPKLGPASEPARDFLVWGPRHHGVPGLVHMLGIESPGLTSSMALAELVVGPGGLAAVGGGASGESPSSSPPREVL